MDDRLAATLARARERFPEALGEPVEERGEVSVDVARERLAAVATFLRQDLPFEMLADWSAVDYLDIRPPAQRFLAAAHLLSFEHNLRLRLRVWMPQDDPRCPSLTGVWPGANWMEREMYDFFGIEFDGHPDLERILMPDGWEGHPQRKDYPLGGTRVEFKGATVPPPDVRRQPTTTTGYPGRIR